MGAEPQVGTQSGVGGVDSIRYDSPPTSRGAEALVSRVDAVGQGPGGFGKRCAVNSGSHHSRGQEFVTNNYS